MYRCIFSQNVNNSEVQNEGQGKGQAGSYVQAKLHLVDLAGSERAKRTGAVGARLKESVGINQVIDALSLENVSVSTGNGPQRYYQLTTPLLAPLLHLFFKMSIIHAYFRRVYYRWAR